MGCIHADGGSPNNVCSHCAAEESAPRTQRDVNMLVVKRVELKRTQETEKCDCHETRHRVLYEITAPFGEGIVLCSKGFDELKKLEKPT